MLFFCYVVCYFSATATHPFGEFLHETDFEVTDREEGNGKQLKLCAEYLKQSSLMLCQPNNHLSESNQLAVYMYTSAALAQTRTDSKNITCTVSLT